jgi:transcriptional regulator with XRE-family HTH domain
VITDLALARKLRAERARARLSVDEVALEAGLSSSRLRRLEAGAEPLQWVDALALSVVYRARVDDLLALTANAAALTDGSGERPYDIDDEAAAAVIRTGPIDLRPRLPSRHHAASGK